MNISLIITTYNRKDALELVLLSVKMQSLMPFEVIVADDGSTSETAELIKHYQTQFPVKLLHCWQEDKGFRVSHIRNKAFAVASGEYIIMVDGDVILHRNFIRSHLEHLASNHFIQGSRVLLSPEATQKAIESKQIHFTPFSKGIKNRINAISNRLFSQLIQVFYKGEKTHKGVRSCNLSCWKSDLIKVNGFSEEFIGWGREDSEFVVRLLNSGISRTNLKFGGVVYHLWHKENKTDDLLKKNDILLERAIAEGRKVCEIGLNQYI
ncbi:MAG: glycosyltransferase [Bacteroidales bacterium]|nr:MAG: glycosyltransferase [Bacteroidales bacterium]